MAAAEDVDADAVLEAEGVLPRTKGLQAPPVYTYTMLNTDSGNVSPTLDHSDRLAAQPNGPPHCSIPQPPPSILYTH